MNANDIRNRILVLEATLRNVTPGTPIWKEILRQLNALKLMLKSLDPEDPKSIPIPVVVFDPETGKGKVELPLIPLNPSIKKNDQSLYEDSTTYLIMSLVAVGGIFLAYKYL